MTATTNIKLSTPAHGSNVDSWDGDPINNNSAILDLAFGSVTSKSLSNVGVTLTDTEAQASVLRFSGALSGNVTVNVGTIIKSWYIDNLTTGNFVVTISGGSGNIVGVPQGETTQVYWDGSNCKFINLGRVGTYEDDCGASVPAWITACTVPPYLLCDGSSFSSGTYPFLAARLGSTTLPDARNRARVPLAGGTGRITIAGAGFDGDTRFAAGGVQVVTIDVTQMPSHSHGVVDPGHVHPPLAPSSGFWGKGGGGQFSSGSGNTITSVDNTGSAVTGISLSNSGSSQPHTNTQPTFIGGITMIRAA